MARRVTTRRAIRRFADPAALARGAAEAFTHRAAAAIADGRAFSCVLSGGSTPEPLFKQLARPSASGRVAWHQVHLFWGDERPVPPDHTESNFGLAQRTLLSTIVVPADNIHRIRAELGAEAAAERYDREIRDWFGLGENEVPRFDLVFLGLGADGHTVSLFPGNEALDETRRFVVAPWVEQVGGRRITLTLPVLNHAACVLFLVTGERKASTLRRVLEGSPSPHHPASLVRPVDGDLQWFVDRPAAHLLSRDG